MKLKTELESKSKTISVIGLGYVGLPLALAFSQHFRVIGYDINKARIAEMQAGKDPSRQIEEHEFEGRDILFTSDPTQLKDAHLHIVCVPTDVDEHKVPDLKAVARCQCRCR